MKKILTIAELKKKTKAASWENSLTEGWYTELNFPGGNLVLVGHKVVSHSFAGISSGQIQGSK